MKTFKFSEGIVVAVVLTLLIGVALYLRVYLPYEHVFSGEWIKFTGIDAYYHMRLVDNLVTHFPERITFDPYTQYPYGRAIGWPPLFDWLLAGTIWLVSLGSPSQHTIDVVGVYFPAIMAGLTLIPVYFIGKELFNHWVGIISAGLVAVLPSAFFSRSILGFTDHHVAETLFTTVTMLFLILAIRSAKHKQLTFGHLRCKEWSVIVKPCVFSLLAGIFLGMYILTWSGGLLFIFLIFVYLIIQSIIDHLKGENIDYLAIIGTTSLLIALIISLPLLPQGVWSRHLYLPSFIFATLTAVGLTGVSHVFMNQRIRPFYYPITLIGLGLAGLAIFYFVAPSLLQSMLGKFDIFTPAGAKLTILEVRPFLFPVGDFSFNLAWANFNTAFFLGLIALIILICLMVKRSTADRNLFVVWSLLMFVAVLGQRRFGYYYTINLALLTAYLSIPIYLTTQLIIDYFRNRNTKDRRIAILQYVGLIQKSAEPVDMPLIRKKDKTKTKRRADSIITNRICATIGAIAIFFLIFFPSIGTSIAIAKEPKFSPDNAWLETLSWIRENTPEPFGNPDTYYEIYELPSKRKGYEYPESAYGVISWWDYGHWITRIAHRIPVSNPFQSGIKHVAEFFTAQDEISANKIMDKVDSKYVVIDHETALSKFHAVVTHTGGRTEDFYDIFYRRVEGELQRVYLFYPAYYQSLAIRLYNFNGDKITAESPVVISYEQKTSPDGNAYKEITSAQQFSSYEEAEAYVSSQKSTSYIIVSTNPYVSPVPLDALDHYKLIYSSETKTNQPDIGLVPSVKVFEYIE